MKRLSQMLLIVACLLVVADQAEKVQKGPVVINEIKHDVSLPLRYMAKLTPVPKHANREIDNHPPGVVPRQVGAPGMDAAVETGHLPMVGTTNLLNFDGQGADGVAPPDTEGSVGGNQYFMVCIAVSNTNDATGSYTRYAFPVQPSTAFPDYPKWGVWPNAYFTSYRDFKNGITFEGGEACAVDRNAVLSGGTATMQCFAAGTNYDVLLPSDLDGLTPPPDGSTNLYLTLGVDTTHIDAFAFHVDFVTPTNSKFTGPTHVTTIAYTLVCQSPFTRACIPQPTGGEKLDSLGGFMMYRNAYRNFGTYESNVLANTVATKSPSTAKSGVRWYEVRGGATAPKVFQQGTRQDNGTTANSYWLPAMAQDKVGDIVLGFSVSGALTDPSMWYVGRVPTDIKGTMESPKKVIVGTGVQKSTSDRWGDYATVSVDPSDDCTFWFTSEYIKTTGSFNWSTRIASFKFPGCL